MDASGPSVVEHARPSVSRASFVGWPLRWKVAAIMVLPVLLAATFHRNGQPTNDARDTVGCASWTTSGPFACMPYHPSPGLLTFEKKPGRPRA